MKYISSLSLTVQPEMNSSQVDNPTLGTQVDSFQKNCSAGPVKCSFVSWSFSVVQHKFISFSIIVCPVLCLSHLVNYPHGNW